MTNLSGGFGPRNSTAQIRENVDASKEQHIAAGYGRALFWQRFASFLWWTVAVPILFGRWLIVCVTAVTLWRVIKPARCQDWRFGILGIITGTSAVMVLLALGAFQALWYPVFWGVDRLGLVLRVGSAVVHLPLWINLVRAVVMFGFPYAWDGSYRLLLWRFTTEIISPTASSVPIQQARASSVKTPRGSTVEFRDPGDDPPPQVIQQPTRAVPLRVAQNAVAVPMLSTRDGRNIETSRVLSMLEAQDTGVGLGVRYWRSQGWTRTEWDTALVFLADAGIVTPRSTGVAAVLLMDVDDAIDAIERMG